MQSKEEKAKPTTHEAKLSVMIFLSGVSVIVLLLLFKNQIGHTLSSRDLIVMIMMFCAWLMYLFCKVDLATIKDAPIFKSGAESLIVVLGIVWFSSTIINAHLPEVKESAVALLEQYPYLLAVVFFLASSVLFSQGSTAALICPVAASLGVDAATIVGSFVACSLHHERLPDNGLCNFVRRHGFLHGPPLERFVCHQSPFLHSWVHQSCSRGAFRLNAGSHAALTYPK